MQGVTFDNYHSFRSWGLMLAKKPVVTPPEPDTKLVKVPFSNVILDLTKAITDKVTYGLREIQCQFVTMEERDKWKTLHDEILSALHGQKMKIVLDDDPDYYYLGYVNVGELEPGKKTATFSITATVEPYKYARHGEGRKL